MKLLYIYIWTCMWTSNENLNYYTYIYERVYEFLSWILNMVSLLFIEVCKKTYTGDIVQKKRE